MPSAPYHYAREVRFDEFRQRVRRHSPSTLLPAIADRALAKLFRNQWKVPPRVETPWGLAAAARASILYGDERRPEATPRDVELISAAFASIKVLPANLGTDDFRVFMLRTAYEQLPYQAALHAEIARTVAMFRDSLAATNPTVLTPEAFTELLGGTVVEFVSVGWILFAAALNNHGWFRDEWIDGPELAEITEYLPPDTLRQLLDTVFAADLDAVRRDGRTGNTTPPNDPQRERFAYNPLVSRPVVRMSPGHYLIPSPLLLLRRTSTTGIYYAAVDALGSSIGADLGAAFEHYVGRQLAQAPHQQIVSEITYGKPEQRTVDWFLILDDLVLLIEVKAPRLTEPARLGDARALARDLERTISKARQQIERTAALLAQPLPEITAAGVPTDRPVRGLIVTLEPYHLVESGLFDQWIADTTVPTSAMSIHELEELVSLSRADGGPGFGEQLTRIQQDSELRTWSPLGAVRHLWPTLVGDNPILEIAGDELAWHPAGPDGATDDQKAANPPEPKWDSGNQPDSTLS